jgi:hypothetical protein
MVYRWNRQIIVSQIEGTWPVLKEWHLTKTKLLCHTFEESHKIGWSQAKIFTILVQPIYWKDKDTAHMWYFDNPISHSSLIIHPFFPLLCCYLLSLWTEGVVSRAGCYIHRTEFYDNFIIFRFVWHLVLIIMITFCSLFILSMWVL